MSTMTFNNCYSTGDSSYFRPIMGKMIIRGAEGETIFEFQFMPESIPESKSAQYSDTRIIGRSSPLHCYSGSDSKVISLKLKFVVAPFQGIANPDPIRLRDKYINTLRKLVYPDFGGGAGTNVLLAPPLVILDLGWFMMRCVVTSVNFTFKSPWSCDTHFNIPHYVEAEIGLKESYLDPLLGSDIETNVSAKIG